MITHKKLQAPKQDQTVCGERDGATSYYWYEVNCRDCFKHAPANWRRLREMYPNEGRWGECGCVGEEVQ